MCCVLSCFSGVQVFVTPWTIVPQTPLFIDSPGKNTGVGCSALLQGIFSTQKSNPHLFHLLHWRVGSLPLAPWAHNTALILQMRKQTLQSWTMYSRTHSDWGLEPGFQGKFYILYHSHFNQLWTSWNHRRTLNRYKIWTRYVASL